MTREQKVDVLRALHSRPGAFVIPNPWDAGSAKILTALGFEALATSSAGYAFSIGDLDAVSPLRHDQILDNARDIAEATDLPVSADMQNGFEDDPKACATIIGRAAELGLAGGSIEDSTGDQANPIYDFNLAVERIAACAEAARQQNFVLTARAENFLHGRPNLDDTIRRLQAFEKAGADVLYAPGLKDIESIRQVCASVTKPVNVVMGLVGATFTVDELAAAGVKRISVGGSFARAALGGLVRAAKEVMERGTFEYASEAIPSGDMKAYMLR